MVAIQEEEAEATTTPKLVAGPITRLLAHTDTTRNSLLSISHSHMAPSTRVNIQDSTLRSTRSQVLAGIPRLRSSSHPSNGPIRDTSIMPLVLTPYRLRTTIPTTLSTSTISSSNSRPTGTSSRLHRSSSSSRHMEPLLHSPMASRMLPRNRQVVLLSSGVRLLQLQLPPPRTRPLSSPISSSMEVAVAVAGITTRPRRNRWDRQSGWALITLLFGTPMLQ